MNKKILQTGSVVVAQTAPTATNPNANYPLVAPGGTVVMEDQVITATEILTPDFNLDVGDIVVLLLPAGVNFSGTPTATATVGLKLESNAAGDPGATGLVTLSDTDSDGGMDRASVTVAVLATANSDTITFKGSITYSGTSTTGNLSPTITALDVSDAPDTFALVDADNVLATKTTTAKAASPIALQNSTTPVAPNASSGADTSVALTAASSHLITVPSGKKTTDTITVTLATGLEFTTTSTIVVTVLTDGAPSLTAAALVNKSTLVFTLGATTSRVSQYNVTINNLETTALATPGSVSGTLSGGVSGSAVVASLSNAGTTVALPTTTPATTSTTLIIGADAAQALPDFLISPVFSGDYGDFTGSETITVTPPTGMTLVGAGTSSCTTGTLGNAIASNVLTLTFTANCAALEKITVTNVTATLASTASTGDKALTLAGSDINFTDGISVVAAAGALRGAVTLAGPTTLLKVGPGTTPASAVVTLTESTYGSVAVATNNPFEVFFYSYIKLSLSALNKTL